MGPPTKPPKIAAETQTTVSVPASAYLKKKNKWVKKKNSLKNFSPENILEGSPKCPLKLFLVHKKKKKKILPAKLKATPVLSPKEAQRRRKFRDLINFLAAEKTEVFSAAAE
jgi:hypothetical protein